MMPATPDGEHVVIRLVELSSSVKYFDDRPADDASYPPDDGDFSLKLDEAVSASQGKINRQRTIKDGGLRQGAWGSGPHGSTAIESIRLISDVIEISFQGAVGAVFLKYARDLLIQWMKNRAGRTLTVEVEGVKISVTGEMDIDDAWAALAKIRAEKSQNPDQVTGVIEGELRKKERRNPLDSPSSGRREPFVGDE